ncbi:MAG: protein kinase [Acidobacteria bacterium]|nr:protein kinase [Acidobacteriota bacterium]
MIGGTISHYKITEKLGEGGMGVVYKAQDTKLDRPVALKFLAPHLLRDEEGRKRFEREAKAAAKLDHPNICTVYEIDEVDGRTFIVMAFLEGRPLSERIKEGPLKLAEALSIATQMAEGLEAAHEKGITHRDIKRDNVMLMAGSRGLVKLMDFGLAQLAGGSKFTREGTTLGTVNYMSPEQAEGAPTGHATDIWSLGVVLHEMVAGERPFRGDFDQAIIYSIMNEPAEPLTAVRTGVPKELERIVNKCLAKKPDQRYHHTDELLADLQGVRKELEPQASRVAVQPAAAKRTSPFIFGGLAGVVLLALGLGWWFGRSTDSGADDPPEYRLTQITQDTGYTGEPALSPDGKLLAYASDRSGEGNLDIWVQQLGGGAPIRLTTDAADDGNPSFSPDGNRIAFRSGRDGGGIYVVPALGGSPPRLLAEGGRNPNFSPDGALVSYVVVSFDSENHRFAKPWVIPTSGGAARPIETNLGWASPRVWSPDGQYLLAVGSIAPRDYGVGAEFDWWLVPTDGGEAVALGLQELFAAAGLAGGGRWFPNPSTWLADGSWVVFDTQTEGGIRNLWRIRVSAAEKRVVGEPQKLTAGIGEQAASVAADGRIAFMNLGDNWDIWSLPIDANRAEVKGDPERIVSGLSAERDPSVSADGRKLVYTSSRAGNDDIWLRDLETNKDTQVTVGPGNEVRSVISPDGTKVVFSRRGQGGSKSYLTELGRGSERLLLEGGSHTDFTPDGKKILFYTGAPIRWKTVDIETGEEQDLGLEHSPDPIHSVRFSPDQKWISFKLANEDCPIFIARVVGGTPQDEDQWITVADSSGPYSGHNWWSPDGNTLYILASRDGFNCIWACSLDPVTKKPLGPLRAVQHFHEQLRFPNVGAAPFGYGLTANKHYMALTEAKANIYLAEPVEKE